MQSIDSFLQRFFEPLHSVSRYVIAFSGGMDSTVLLHGMNRLGLPLHAVHVNHHLQEECEQWQQHCHEVCRKWEIALTLAHAKVEKLAQQSIEENARQARYRLFSEQLGPHDALVTAHHKDDQAETLLLQLLRGAGPAGLASMGMCQKLACGMHLRPLLGFSRAELKEYAQQNSLVWVEDPSNHSPDFDRNYLRLEIMPRLVRRWPGALKTMSRAAGLQDEAMQCLRELASLDLLAAATDHSHILKVEVLQHLETARLKNALRGWMKSHDIRAPDKRLLDGVVENIVSRQDLKSSPVQAWTDGEIRRYRNRLYLLRPMPKHDPAQTFQWKVDRPLVIRSLNRTLHLSDLQQSGVAVPENVKELTVRFRRGGEKLRPVGEKHHKSLKNLFQEGSIPPWERDRIPLVYHDGRLLCVLGYWNAAPEQCA